MVGYIAKEVPTLQRGKRLVYLYLSCKVYESIMLCLCSLVSLSSLQARLCQWHAVIAQQLAGSYYLPAILTRMAVLMRNS